MDNVTQIFNIVIGSTDQVDIIYHNGLTVYGDERLNLLDAIIISYDFLEESRYDMFESFKLANLQTPKVYQYVCDLQQLVDCDESLEIN